MSDAENLYAAWKREERQPFVGFDFSYLRGRLIEEDPPWSYESSVRGFLQEAESVLDLGTGGGEVLSTFRDVLPRFTVATEQHPPNVFLAQKRLRPLGAPVVVTPDSLYDMLPFADESFDLVIDRHAAFNMDEVARVLKPGGLFHTQQVDGRNLNDLVDAFDRTPPQDPFTLQYVLDRAAATNLQVEVAEEWSGWTRFTDVGALVYFLRAIPWVIEDFSVDGCLPYLQKQQERLAQNGELRYTQRLLMFTARKPAADSGHREGPPA